MVESILPDGIAACMVTNVTTTKLEKNPILRELVKAIIGKISQTSIVQTKRLNCFIYKMIRFLMRQSFFNFRHFSVCR